MHALSNNNIYNTRYISKSRDVSSGWRHSGWDFCPNTDGVALIVHVVPGLLKVSRRDRNLFNFIISDPLWEDPEMQHDDVSVTSSFTAAEKRC